MLAYRFNRANKTLNALAFILLFTTTAFGQVFNYYGKPLGLAEIQIEDSTNFWHGGNNLGYTSSFMVDPTTQFGYVFFTNADQCNGMKRAFETILWD